MDPNMKQRLPTDDFVTPVHVKNSQTFTMPTLDGSFSLPMLVDFHAEHSAKHPWAVYPNADGTLTTLTWRHLASAAQKFALSLQDVIGPGPFTTENKPVVAVLANRDTLTYNTCMIGILRAGATAFLISPRNSPTGVVHLCKVSGASVILGSSDALEKRLVSTVVKELGDDKVKMMEAPLFNDIFDLEHPSWPLMAPLTTPEDNNQTALIIHSSGTTSFPKPIPLSFLGMIQWARIPCYGARDMCGERVGIQSAPPFHGMNFFHVVSVPAASGSCVSSFAPSEPPARPTPESVLAAWRATDVTIGTGPPSNLVEWSKDEEAVKTLKKLRWLRVGGGPLPSPIGDALVARGVKVLNGWGTTEVGVLSNPAPEEHYGKDWEYIQCTRNAQPIFEETEEGSGVYEICFGITPTHVPSVFNDKENWIYRTSDLCTLHPTRKGFFKIVGRSDDQLMLSTGEKTNPGPMESIIKGDRRVLHALYFGRGRFQNGVLIQPSADAQVDVKDEKAVAAFRNAIWPSIAKANDYAPTHSRIFKEMIVVGSGKDKPFLLTPKGTVSRPKTLDLYAEEVDECYAAAENSSRGTVVVPAEPTAENIEAYVLAVVNEVMRPDGGAINKEQDIFHQGCDSLQATFIKNRLLKVLRDRSIKTNTIPANWVYLQSTVPVLAASFFGHLTASGAAPVVNDAQARIELLTKTAARFTADYATHTGTQPAPAKATVLLTGSTGTLGCYLLDELIKDSSVEKVYAVNRPSSKSGVERQAEASIDRGLDPATLKGGKVVFVDADISKAGLGVSPALFEEIRNSVTLIIHNAHRLDFNLSLASFEPNMQSLRNLVDLALASPFSTPPTIFNSSSVSVVSSHPHGWVPEGPADPSFTAPTGYGQSKFVNERILEEAPLPSCSVRIGQLSGSTVNGAWNSTDWLPMLVKSGISMGYLPTGGDTICWLQVDLAAKAILEMTKAANPPATVHLVHPHPIKWSAAIDSLAKAKGIPTKPYAEWITELASQSDMVATPALRILPFFQAKPLTVDGSLSREAIGIPRAETKVAESYSMTLKNLPALTDDDFTKWLSYWKF